MRYPAGMHRDFSQLIPSLSLFTLTEKRRRQYKTLAKLRLQLSSPTGELLSPSLRASLLLSLSLLICRRGEEQERCHGNAARRIWRMLFRRRRISRPNPVTGRGEHVHGLIARGDAGLRALGFGIVEGQKERQGLVVGRVWFRWCGKVKVR